MPKVSILMAVYQPNEIWLEKQLKSLDAQTYKDIEILICDDCPENPVDSEMFRKYLTRFPFRLFVNEKNIGSNKTFEYLTKLSNGDYIAYCDQDDIWENNKISTLVEYSLKTQAQLVFSDASIIDKNDRIYANSITSIRRHHVFLSGEGLSKPLLTRNFVMGCTMLIKQDVAKAALPFVDTMVHDHWLALYASTLGTLVFVDIPLIRYRQHGRNQTGVLMGVNSKADYLFHRIVNMQNRMEELNTRFLACPEILSQINEIQLWLEYRNDWWCRFSIKSALLLWKSRKLNLKTTIFELIIAHLPNSIFDWAMEQLKNGRL